MAESVTSSLLTVAPVDPAQIKSTKIAKSADKSAQNSDFSRVLDDQQRRDQASARRSDSAVQGQESSGNALPPQGSNTAGSAANEVSGETAGAHQTAVEGARDPGAADADIDSGAGTFGELVSELVGESAGKTAEELAAKAGATDAATLPTDPAAVLDADLALDAVVGTVVVAPADAPEALTAPLTAPQASLAAAPHIAVNVVNRAKTTALQTPGGAQSGIPSADIAALPQSAGQLPSAGVATAAGREALPFVEPSLLNRSTVDWLRAGVGSEPGQRGLADSPFDGAGELARSLGAGPRGDAPPVLPASVTVGALAPTATAPGAAAPIPPGSSAALPEYALARAPDDVDFPGELTARMKTLVRDGVREARLQLHPAELGRLQVTVTTEGDQTRVAFTVENAAAREAIEQSLPRLKEMLEQSGLQLAQSDVGQQDLQGEARRGDGEQSAEGQQNAIAAADADGTDADATTMLTSTLASLTSTRIDTYI